MAGRLVVVAGDDGDLALVEQAVELAGAALVAPVVELPQVPRKEAQAHAVHDLPQHARRPPPPSPGRRGGGVRRHLVRRRRHGWLLCFCSWCGPRRTARMVRVTRADAIEVHLHLGFEWREASRQQRAVSAEKASTCGGAARRV